MWPKMYSIQIFVSVGSPMRVKLLNIKVGRSANKFCKSQIRKFADFNNWLDLAQMRHFADLRFSGPIFVICGLKSSASPQIHTSPLTNIAVFCRNLRICYSRMGPRIYRFVIWGLFKKFACFKANIPYSPFRASEGGYWKVGYTNIYFLI